MQVNQVQNINLAGKYVNQVQLSFQDQQATLCLSDVIFKSSLVSVTKNFELYQLHGHLKVQITQMFWCFLSPLF